jgi:hypothetical protein
MITALYLAADEAATWPKAFAMVGAPLGVLLGFAAIIWAFNR